MQLQNEWKRLFPKTMTHFPAAVSYDFFPRDHYTAAEFRRVWCCTSVYLFFRDINRKIYMQTKAELT